MESFCEYVKLSSHEFANQLNHSVDGAVGRQTKMASAALNFGVLLTPKTRTLRPDRARFFQDSDDLLANDFRLAINREKTDDLWVHPLSHVLVHVHV